MYGVNLITSRLDPFETLSTKEEKKIVIKFIDERKIRSLIYVFGHCHVEAMDEIL